MDKLEKVIIPTDGILGDMVKARLITEEGFRVGGLGILIKKIEDLIAMQDKTNLKLYILEKAIRETKNGSV